MEKLIEGEDFYYNEDGFVVLTAKYHKKRGYCCGNKCKHCPYGYEKVGKVGKVSEVSKGGTGGL